MKRVYLILAIVGAIVPYFFFLQEFSANGINLVSFLAAGFANPVAAGFSADLVISSFVFWILMFTSGKQTSSPWPFVAINLLVGLSCALPAWLYWRSAQDQYAAA